MLRLTRIEKKNVWKMAGLFLCDRREPFFFEVYLIIIAAKSIFLLLACHETEQKLYI